MATESVLRPKNDKPRTQRLLTFTRRAAAVLAFAAPLITFTARSGMWGGMQSQLDMTTWKWALSSLTNCASAFLYACRIGVVFGFLWFFAGYFESVLASRRRLSAAQRGG